MFNVGWGLRAYLSPAVVMDTPPCQKILPPVSSALQDTPLQGIRNRCLIATHLAVLWGMELVGWALVVRVLWRSTSTRGVAHQEVAAS